MRQLKLFLLLLPALCAAPVHGQDPLVQTIMDAVDADTMMWNLDRLSGQQEVDIGSGPMLLLNRHKLSPGNDQSATWLQQKLAQYGWSSTTQTFSSTGHNILAVRPGLVHPGRAVILCAHYDAIPAPPALAPAADDDGTGVVAVLEAARILQDALFENTLILALWDEEEQGKIGSIYYANVAAANDDTLLAVVNMDAIGWDGNGDGLMRVHARPTAANSVAIKDSVLHVNSTYGVNMPIAVNTPGALYSDHASFWAQNYGAVLMIEDFDNDGNIYYHTPSDLAIHIDVPYFRRIAQLSIGTAMLFARPISITAGNNEPPVHTSALSVHPNPTQDIFVVSALEGRVQELRMFDMTGAQRHVPVSAFGGSSLLVDATALAPGIYLLEAVHADGRRTTTRLVRQ
ncbi:MAG: M20/M25/M40 family metallo-hydrolase [Flavobacteriales bacterium]|nr:M20/M25/M40 family metallo-hydrolase [Flavobacteriales bacterium]